MNCLTDIVNTPQGYDNRESILVSKESNDDMVSLVGKGFSRVTSLAFAVIKGADFMEHIADDPDIDKAMLARSMELWEVLLTSNS